MSTLPSDLLSGLLAEVRVHVGTIREQLERINGQPDQEAILSISDELGILANASVVLDLSGVADLLAPVQSALDGAEKADWVLSGESRALLEAALPQVEDVFIQAQVNADLAEGRADLVDFSIPDLPSELADIFTQEAFDHIHTIQIGMENLRKAPSDLSLLADLRRATHTLKGAAGSVGYDAIARTSHLMEDVIDLHIDTGDPLPANSIAVLLDMTDLLELLLDPSRSAETPALLKDVFERCQSVLAPQPDMPLAAEPQAIVSPDTLEPAAAPANSVRLPIEDIDLLINRVGEIVINRSAFERHLNTMRGLLSEMDNSTRRLNRLAGDINTQIEAGPWGRAGNRQRGEALFDPIELDHYTVLHQYARELEEATTDAADVNGKLHYLTDDFDGSLIRERRLTNELQGGLMAARLVSFHEIETRLHQIVRRTSQSLGKRVELSLSGFDMQVDKQILETLLDPLTHLIRNAIDHGIEPGDERAASGKSPVGLISVSIMREHGRVTINLSDDGRGISFDRVQKRAAASGLMNLGDTPTADAVIDLLFVDGFSAADAVTQTSGRGVGLSIVKRAINSLQGLIRVETRAGAGATFILSVPITLAITRSIYVQSGDQVFAVPLEQISGVIQISPVELANIRDMGIVHNAGKSWGVFNLADFVRRGGDAPQYGLLVETHSSQKVVLVNELLGIHETVVKQMGSHLRKVHGIAGATISGDGRVILILDLPELIGEERHVTAPPKELPPPPERVQSGERQVLVVDDSPSVRRVVSSFLERSGWKAILAKDGIDALDKLAHFRPDVALVDIEMPRMNGYDLLSTMKSDPNLSDIPVVFLTSRSATKHRQRAMQLHVDGYLVKPYKEDQLLAELRRVTEGVPA